MLDRNLEIPPVTRLSTETRDGPSFFFLAAPSPNARIFPTTDAPVGNARIFPPPNLRFASLSLPSLEENVRRGIVLLGSFAA